ncbi:MAG TPA: hypothetical protein VLA61_27725, partial [Ideonella sp.]|uniref:hypothetical protein n=1 Tax=Ideonella sp. TaxID=1929293 RepID=UPI002B885FBF
QDLPSTTECKQGAVAESAKANFGYDARNRLLSTSYGDGTTLGTTRTLTGDGLPATVAKGNTTWTYAYNRRRQLPHQARIQRQRQGTLRRQILRRGRPHAVRVLPAGQPEQLQRPVRRHQHPA